MICGLTLPDMMRIKNTAIHAPEKQRRTPQTAAMAESS